MEIMVKSKFVKCSPRKMRLATNLIKKLALNDAKAQLKYLNKEAAKLTYELLKSAAAGAKEKDMDLEQCFVKEILSNDGPALKRRRMRERGRSTTIK